MCLDISYKIDAVGDSLYDYLPNLQTDPQLNFDFSASEHIQAHARSGSEIIYLNAEGIPYLTTMEWGLITKYMAMNPEAMKMYANNMFNARSENILVKKSAWYPLRKNRCLLVASGIYEHRKIEGWKKKAPYFVHLAGKKTLLIPSIYNFVEMPDPETGELTGTFALITRDANTLMAQIHNDGPNKHRMPLFMQPEKAVQWLNKDMTDEQIKEFLSYEIPNAELETWPVYTIRSPNPRPDGLGKSAAYDWPGLPALA
jgi:putative SOS response-associated peptidase YedK